MMGGRRPASGAGSYFNASSNPRVAATGQKVGVFEMDFAGNGAEALRMYRQKHHDLLIIDNYMPQKNGIDVLRDLQDDQLLYKTHVMMVTSEVNKALVSTIRSEMLKIDDLVLKPVDFEKFKEKISMISARHRGKTKKDGPVLSSGTRDEKQPPPHQADIVNGYY